MEFEKQYVYCEYINRPDADAAIICKILEEVDVWGQDKYCLDLCDCEQHKDYESWDSKRAIVYTAYINRRDADAALVNRILNAVHTLKGVFHTEAELKLGSYTAYVARTDADTVNICKIFNEIKDWPPIDKLIIYTAYIARADASDITLNQIFKETNTWSSADKAKIISAYMSRTDANQTYSKF